MPCISALGFIKNKVIAAAPAMHAQPSSTNPITIKIGLQSEEFLSQELSIIE
jgi:hypothetical protein